MRIEMSQTSVAAQFYYGSTGQTANTQPAAPRAEHGDHHRRVNRDDQVSLSSDARELQRVKHDHHREDDPMRALDKLTGKLLKSMMKAFTGREFNLVRPDQVAGLQAPSSAATLPSAAATVTNGDPAVLANSANPPAGPYGNAVAAYYQVQSFSMSFSASGTVDTEDGQQMGVSLQFSFSQQFYAAVAVAGGTPPAEDGGAGTPINASFQGVAAQLTQTSFNFELDFGGQPATPVPVEGNVPNGTETASAAPGTTPAAANPVGGDEAENPFLEELDKLFEKLRVWMHQADGTRQLIAYGLNNTTAVYLGITGGAAADGGTTAPSSDTATEQTPVLDAVA
jgi:hypothetical protein